MEDKKITAGFRLRLDEKGGAKSWRWSAVIKTATRRPVRNAG